MKRSLVLITIFVIISVAYTDTDNCQSGFYNNLKSYCEDLSPTDANAKTKCIYEDNKCIEEYSTCESYAPTSDFSDSVCKLIPTSSTQKCVVKTEAGRKKCVTENKDCNDGNNDLDNCINFDAGTDKRCVLINNKCEAHYEDCSRLTTEQTCIANIGKGLTKKCKWVSGACTNGDRTCEEGLASFTDKYTGRESGLSCISLFAEEGKRCVLYQGSCKTHQETCTGLTETQCISNIPIGHLSTCVWETNTCTEKKRTCAEGEVEFTDKYNNNVAHCINLDAGDNDKRCVLTGGSCQAHYTSCVKLKNKKECDDNIGKGLKKICRWDEAKSECYDDDRTCEEGIAHFTDKDTGSEGNLGCFDLYAETGYRCVMYDNKCQTHKESCAELSSSECNSNIPKDKKKKCNYEGNTCKEIDRLCSQAIVYTEKGDYVDLSNCLNLKASANSKVCYLKEQKKCEEYYPKCESANSNDCGNTKPLNDYKNGFKPNYKCSYDSDKTVCEEVKKKCSEYDSNSGDTCHLLDPLSDYKSCVLDSDKGVCESKYTKCEDYNSDVEKDRRVKETCEGITLSQSSPYKYCVFDSTKKSCDTKTKPCSLLTTKGQCHNQYFADEPNKRCLFLTTGKCVESLKTCEAEGANANKTFCEQIEPAAEYSSGNINYFNCTFSEKEGVKSCTKKKIECEYYKERLTEDHYCSSLSNNIDDGKTRCVEKNGKCTSQYTSCESYEGGDEKICKAILKENKYSNQKCVLNSNNKCVTEQKSCTEYEGDNYSECENNFKASSNDKRCVFINNKCIEQFKTCALYEQETTIDKTTCESIRIKDESDLTGAHDYPTYYCKWADPASGATKGTCTATKRGCTEFNIDDYKTDCGSTITAAVETDKCVYNNKVCSTKAKTCLELDYIRSITGDQVKDICKNRETSSSNLICEANEDLDGCYEKQKPNSAGQKMLNRIMLALLVFLLA